MTALRRRSPTRRSPPDSRQVGTTLDGAIVVDKPAGMTSHDVVAAVRRALAIARVGHTGTLDPLATGVLPLLLGRATRLARFLADARKTYEAHVRFGWATTTGDALGEPLCERVNVELTQSRLETLLDRFRGSFEQTPPAFSAKRVDGRRAYALARRERPPVLAPVSVTVDSLELVGAGGDTAVLRVTCSAGFYVRSLAHDLGLALGTGAHLSALRRTVSGAFNLDQAVTLEALLRDPATASRHVAPMTALLPGLPLVRLDDAAAEKVRRGQDVEAGGGVGTGETWARLATADGSLVAVAKRSERHGFLHPVVVLI